MKSLTQTLFIVNQKKRLTVGKGLAIIMLQLFFFVGAKADFRNVANGLPLSNDSLKIAIQLQLNNSSKEELHFPKTVKRFYELLNYNPYWLTSSTDIKKILTALLLFDCTKQYGLNATHYHPEVVNYTQLHDVLDKLKIASDHKKANFELKLTDAIIALINHLHFGKYNPNFKDTQMDEADFALQSLTAALNDNDFINSILNTQPKCLPYQKLQNQMRLVAGQYICDSYEISDSDFRKMTINLERLRWFNWEQPNIHINIPSYTLNYNLPNYSRTFKVVVGKPSTPTPTLQSTITHFNSAPNWRVPKSIFTNELIPKALKDIYYFNKNNFLILDKKGNIVPVTYANLERIKHNPSQFSAVQNAGCDNALGKIVFRFTNTYGIYLHDSPEQQLFKNKTRAYSHGCIRLENADELALLLLKNDGQDYQLSVFKQAIKNYRKQTFNLKLPMPIYVTYLTCSIADERLETYPDLYKLDKELENLMFK